MSTMTTKESKKRQYPFHYDNEDDYEDYEYSHYDDVYFGGKAGGGAGGGGVGASNSRGSKGRRKGNCGTSFYSSKHTRILAERRKAFKTKK